MPLLRLLLFVTTLLTCPMVACADSADPLKSIVSVHSVEGGVAGYDPVAKVLRFFELQNGALSETRRLAAEQAVWRVIDFDGGYLVASGYGRGSLDAPIRLRWFSKDGTTSKVVFEKPGERSQVTLLKRAGNRLWFTFFDSKYITKTGYFIPSSSTPWTFTEKFSMRLGDAVDVEGDTVAIGRPYGDAPEQDGDLTVYLAGIRHEVPTHRGVRAVLLLGDPANPDLLLADGWHQNYGQSAQARLALAKRNSAQGTFTSTVVDLDATQYGFSKLLDLSIDGKTYVAALGNKALHVYSSAANWKRTVVHTRQSENSLFDVALLKVEPGKASFAVVDQGLRLVSFLPNRG
ncbi:MAG: hypothetical protein RL518_2282 [Pseudomonadota bacterium]